MYKFYRMLPSGVWKYTDAFNSTLDPNYHDLISYYDKVGVAWKLVDTYGNIKFQNQ